MVFDVKVLFVENRFKTVFWARCASEIKKLDNNVEIRWLAQNHYFSPTSDCFNIPYPKKVDLEYCETPFFSDLEKRDRSVYIYGGRVDHYKYYYDVIYRYLENEKPDFVIGEVTLFHEQMVVEACKKLNIQFLHPSPTRYPLGKFALLDSDSLNSYDEKEFEVNDEDLAIIDGIVNKSIVPSYMSFSIGFTSVRGTIYKLYNTYTSLRSRLTGECYNTPSPVVKYKFQKMLANNKSRLERCAQRDQVSHDDLVNGILYPLQMQPEANLDVWGYPHNDQLKNLKRLVSVLQEGEKVIVKPNPRSKYELSDELLDYVESCDRVVCLSQKTKMTDIFDSVCRVYSVTGTVGIETILAQKALITEKESLFYGYPNSHYVEDSQILPAEVKFPLERIITHSRGNSYFGEISDPIYSKTCTLDTNVKLVAGQLLKKLKES
ncbi:hypothetical protein GGC03_00855 [Vibrio sp. THAF191c]|nr:hypothetical protein FIU99_00855 [Vibrio sp. THAF64]QGM32886.1 hypothetical protein GGC04_00860 [Vibrio sp. THAF191d]QGN68388.1 hypothetical protein GGC03_00855 [Vibrio sp. THAF191c]